MTPTAVFVAVLLLALAFLLNWALSKKGEQ